MLTRLPSSLSVPLLYISITLAYLYRFLFGNIFGIFLIALVAYRYSESWFGITPLNAEGLARWILNQSESTKAALLGAMVTVLGFLVAYATATANWKSQLLATLKVQAAGEIEVFFTQCARLSTDCAIYASALMEAINRIQNGCSAEEAAFLAHYNTEQGQLFLQKRQQLIALGIEVYRYHGKYATLLISAPGLKRHWIRPQVRWN